MYSCFSPAWTLSFGDSDVILPVFPWIPYPITILYGGGRWGVGEWEVTTQKLFWKTTKEDHEVQITTRKNRRWRLF